MATRKGNGRKADTVLENLIREGVQAALVTRLRVHAEQQGDELARAATRLHVLTERVESLGTDLHARLDALEARVERLERDA